MIEKHLPQLRLRSPNAGSHGSAEMGSIWEDVAKGDLSKVKAWLHNHIHRHARLYSPGTLFEMACGKFDAKYYTDDVAV